jgi:hypothetical protein
LVALALLITELLRGSIVRRLSDCLIGLIGTLIVFLQNQLGSGGGAGSNPASDSGTMNHKILSFLWRFMRHVQ